MPSHIRLKRYLSVCLLAAFTWSKAIAGEASAQGTFDFATPVAASELDRLRGGFTTEGGLQFTLGIERVTAINGDIVAHASMALSHGGGAASSMPEARATVDQLDLIQNGGGNAMLAPISSSTLGGTIIQNSLSGQHIAHQTTITAAVNSSALLNSLNFHASLSDALAHAAVSR